MKFTLAIFILFFFQSKAQDISYSACDSNQIKFDENIRVFIEGRESDSAIKRKFFRKHFKLTSLDKEVKILSFHMAWSNPHENIVVERVNTGPIVYPELEVNGVKKGDEYSLSHLPPGIFLAFDNILVKKGDTCYKASPFIIHVKL